MRIVLQALIFLIGSQVAAAATTLLARDVAAVEQDLSLTSANLTALDTALHSFLQSGGSLVQALTIHTDSASSLSAIDTTISDIKATGTIGATDAPNIENTVAGMLTTIIDICQTFSQNLAVIGAGSLSIKSLLEQDMSSLLSAFDSLLIIFKGSTPTPVSSEIASLQQQFESVCKPSTVPVKPVAL